MWKGWIISVILIALQFFSPRMRSAAFRIKEPQWGPNTLPCGKLSLHSGKLNFSIHHNCRETICHNVVYLSSNVRNQDAVSIAAELLKLVERAVLDPKKEGKPWLKDGNFDWYIFKKSIHILLDTWRPFF